MKRARALILALLLFSVFFTSATACADSGRDPFMTFLESTPVESLLSAGEQAALLQTYASEFSFLQQKHGDAIAAIDEGVVDLIKAEAVSFAGDSAYAFGSLLDAISALRFENAVAAFNAGELPSAQAQATPKRVNPDKTEIRNAVRTTVVAFGPLKAEHDRDVAAGVTQTFTDEFDVGVESDELVQGFKITASLSTSVSFSISGPADFTEVRSGVYATHRAGYGVLFGRIERYTYDLYNSYTGELISHHEYISIRDEEAAYHTFLASYGNPTYLKHARYDRSYSFKSRSACISGVCSNPGTYIN